MGAFTMELEKVNNTLLTEKQQKRREREQKQEYEQKLFNIFYNYFRSKQHDFELNYKKLNNINKREEILYSICKNKKDIMYLNTLYSKKLKEVYKIFKDNYIFIQEQEQKEQEEEKQQIQILVNDLQKVIKQKEQTEQIEKINQNETQQKNIIFNIILWFFALCALIYLIIKYIIIIGIVLIIVVFLVILGCSQKQ